MLKQKIEKKLNRKKEERTYQTVAIQPGLISAKQPGTTSPKRAGEEVVSYLEASSSVAPGTPSIPVDAPDEGRRPSSSIKSEPPPWISPRISILSPSPSCLAGTETLALAEPLAVARDHPERRRVASKLRHGFLLLHVKPIEAGSSQSTPTSSACRSPAAVDLLLLTIPGLADELYSSVVSS
jgi:hypothetical protein